MSQALRTLYPSHATYVTSVTAAADELVRLRHILAEDARRYVEAAQAKNFAW